MPADSTLLEVDGLDTAWSAAEAGTVESSSTCREAGTVVSDL
jgi:hypothetical protein